MEIDLQNKFLHLIFAKLMSKEVITIIRLGVLLSGSVHQEVIKLNNNKEGWEIHDLTNHGGLIFGCRKDLPHHDSVANIGHYLSAEVSHFQEWADFVSIDKVSRHGDGVLLWIEKELHEDNKNHSKTKGGVLWWLNFFREDFNRQVDQKNELHQNTCDDCYLCLSTISLKKMEICSMVLLFFMHFDFTEVCDLMNIFREVITESGLHPILLVLDLIFLPLLSASPALAS